MKPPTLKSLRALLALVLLISQALSVKLHRETFNSVGSLPEVVVGVAAKTALQLGNQLFQLTGAPYFTGFFDERVYFRVGSVGYVVSMHLNPIMDNMTSRSYIGGQLTAADVAQSALELVKWMEDLRKGKTMYPYGAIGYESDNSCALGGLFYDIYQDNRSLPPLWSNNVHRANRNKTGVLSGGFPPLVLTNLARDDLLPRAPKTNGQQLCSRADNVWAACKGSDTIVSGTILGPGQSLYSELGARLYVEKGGNLCLYYYKPDPVNYWC
ncbi:hypothetical protein BC939DRAFT_491809 [Gamsiella multidivaricata]|uniref:uncharacterized protein n=1 Tax=Gamsiella multidivaricata TaxID=101098 RepID=UPI002220CE2A|nr:uncharacterized protein BC939DRAFT_491809 [Gamsiella multidivaricata]KAG0364912.1 hypothetical protein BGZ54_007039 [Gamsiella multidivaricata]KAI7826137.1 hypothetical protein BC939DRAFT_491809 [Gamsiella multidivaricata]